MQIHLVDATYELFRAHYAPRPPVLGRDGLVLSGVSGLCDQLLYLLREEGATHVGCATDHVIESFRNDLFPGYKSSAGMDPALLAQFPIAEEAIEALGVVLWPKIEFEADDAIGAAAARFAADPDGRADPDLHARQGHGPVRGRRPGRPPRPAPPDHLRPGRRPREVGRRAGLDPGLAGPRRRLVRRLSRACPAGARSRRPPSSGATARSTTSRRRRASGRCRASAARSGWPRSSSSSTRPRSSTGRSPGSGSTRRSPSGTPPSSSGAARRARRGRRSAIAGASTGCDPGRTAGAGAPRPDAA